eukprot:gene16538-19653_t
MDLQNYHSLIKTLEPNGTLVRVQALHGGISASTTRLEVILKSGEKKDFVVRRPSAEVLERLPEAASDEFRLLEFLHGCQLKVPIPVLLDGKGKFLGTQSLVLEFIEGHTEFSPDDLTDSITQMAVQMAGLHNLDTGNAGSWIGKIDPGAFMLKEVTSLPVGEQKVRQFLELHWPLPSCNKPVLVHGDFWPGNILWNNKQLAAVIDWESAGIADPLLDLAITRLDILWLFGKAAMDEFTTIYQGLSKTDLSNLPYWDLWASTRPNGQLEQWANVYPGLGRADVTAAAMKNNLQYFVQQAFEKVI